MPLHWTHPGLADADDLERRRIESRMDEFWRQFTASAKDIAAVFDRGSDLDVVAWMQRWLDPVSPEIMWEFGPAVRGAGHRLVLSGESACRFWPMVDAFLARAPSIPGWEFYAWRLREDWPTTILHVEGHHGVSLAGAKFRARPGSHGLLDVEVAAPIFAEIEQHEALVAASFAIEKLAGERDMDIWIGDVTSTPPLQPSMQSDDDWREMSDLPSLLDTHKIARRAGLERRSFADAVMSGAWTIWKLDPPKRTDYPGQLDLLVGKSGLREIWECAHDTRFFAERFVTNGETLAYVKLDGRDGIEDEEFADKSSMEDALDNALRREGLGAFVGGGTGLFYSYIDVTLCDVVRGVEVIRDVLTRGRVARRSWILFMDARLEREWVPIYVDGPPAPMTDDVDPTSSSAAGRGPG